LSAIRDEGDKAKVRIDNQTRYRVLEKSSNDGFCIVALKPTQQDHSCKNRTKVVETVANENEAGLRMT